VSVVQSSYYLARRTLNLVGHIRPFLSEYLSFELKDIQPDVKREKHPDFALNELTITMTIKSSEALG